MSTQLGRAPHEHVRRFHLPHTHLNSVFGNDWFGQKAESFARFFGTSTFLVAQTVIVAVWIWVNMVGWTQFDVYPFILLNLAFSLQAAYAAPLILLARPGRPTATSATTSPTPSIARNSTRSTRSASSRCRSNRA